jgi:hypothetical protein
VYQEGLTYRREFFVETIHKATQDITGVANFLGIFSNNPDEGRSGIRLIQLINALAQSRDDTFVARVFPEDVLDDNDRFLNDVVHLGVDEIQQRVNAPLAGALNLDGNLADCPDSSADKVHIDFKGILLQFSEELIHIAVIRYAHHNLKFLELDIWRVIVFAEENAEFFVQNVRLFLQQKVDIS